MKDLEVKKVLRYVYKLRRFFANIIGVEVNHVYEISDRDFPIHHANSMGLSLR